MSDELPTVKRALAEFMEHARGSATVVNDKFVVSTVKLPLSYDYLWETMVFPVKDGSISFAERDCRRYESEREAAAGHDAMVAKWSLLDAAGKADGALFPADIPEG